MRIPFVDPPCDQPATKQMVVLAVSFKHNGRCLAGREVEFDSQGNPKFGQWVRPVSRAPSGELYPAHYQYGDGADPAVLDIVRLYLCGRLDDRFQPENWLIDEAKRPELIGRLDARYLPELCDHPVGLWLEPGRFTDRVSAGHLHEHPAAESLCAIWLDEATVTPDPRRRYRLNFDFGGERYSLKITDTSFEDRYHRWLVGLSDDQPLEFHDLLVCFSLGLEFEGYHYKLAAGVVPGRTGVPLYTIGHSNRSVEEFVTALHRHGVDAIADVRSQPSSQRFPQFSRNALSVALRDAGIAYVHLGDELGARRNEPECYVGGQVQYEIAARTPAFRRGIERIVKGSERYTIALMCAERDPLACHRTILVCRHLWQYGFNISHILDEQNLEPHHDAELRLCREEKINPDQSGLFTSVGNPLAQAFAQRGAKIAYQEEAGQGEDLYDRVHAEER